MATFAQLITTGYLVDDPYFSASTAQKGAFARFRILHNPLGKDAQGNDRPAIPINVSTYGKTAEIVEKFAKKGTQVLVSGRIVGNSLARNKDGVLVQTKAGEYIINLDMDATEFQLLGSKADNPATKASAMDPGLVAAASANDPF